MMKLYTPWKFKMEKIKRFARFRTCKLNKNYIYLINRIIDYDLNSNNVIFTL